jgi:putative colanic acid biosynthesis UDP-glucose lipid carrier transferase
VQPLAGLGAFVAAHAIDEVWVSLPLAQSTLLEPVLAQLRNSTANVRYMPDMLGLFLLNRGMTEILDMPMLDLSVTPMRGINRALKRAEDALLSMLILLLISPLLLLIALAVKLTSRGPVLFRQKRHGWDGREIEVWKFRSMRLHHEAPGALTQARREDPRLTRFGAFLRHSSLDELPQFFNVLKGDMSIVGPRPHAVEHNALYMGLIDHYALRHTVKPGITGWAQINGWRGETETVDKMKGRIEHDLYYIEHWSLGFDLRIIALTLVRGFVSKNAY